MIDPAGLGWVRSGEPELDPVMQLQIRSRRILDPACLTWTLPGEPHWAGWVGFDTNHHAPQPTQPRHGCTAQTRKRAKRFSRIKRNSRERESGEPAAAASANLNRAHDYRSRRPGPAASHRLRATCIHGSAVMLTSRKPVVRPAR